MIIPYITKNNYEYIIENGIVMDAVRMKVVPGKQLFEEKKYELLKRAFVSAERYFDAYVLDEIQSHTQEVTDIEIDLEFLHDSIVKLWLSDKLSSTTIEDLIKCYIKDSKEYQAIYDENIGRFLIYIEEAV